MDQTISESFEPLEILVQIILHQYFSKSYCVTIATEQKFNFKNLPENVTLIRITPEDNLLDVTLTVSEMGCSDYVVQMAEPESFLVTFDKATRLGNARRSDKKIILLPSHKDTATTKLLKVLKLKETTFVINVLLVVPIKLGNCESYDLVTHKFAGPDTEASNPVYLDRWSSCTNRFERNANLFPNSMSNLYGKTVRAACFQLKPFSLLGIEESIEPLGRDGTDIRIADELCRWINCTLKIVRDDAHEWGTIYGNGTGNGVLGAVYEDRADLAMIRVFVYSYAILYVKFIESIPTYLHFVSGGLGAWISAYKHLDFSTHGVKCSMTCIAPAPMLLQKWELPMLPFSWDIWILLFFLSIYASLALFCAQLFSAKEIFFTTYRIMLSQAKSDSKASWRVRRITGYLLFTMMIMSNAYGAGMATVFTVPRYGRSVDTIQDLVDRKMDWAATNRAWTFSLEKSQEPKIKELVKQFRKYDPDVLKKKIYEKKIAFAIAKMGAGFMSIGDYIAKDVVSDYMIMLEDFYIEQSLLMGRKGSPYLTKVSELMLRLHEGGLLQAWETQVVLKYLDYKVQLAVKFSRLKKETIIVPLGFYHVVGIYILYGMSLSVSCIVFLIEFYYGKTTKKSIPDTKTTGKKI